MKYIYIDDYNYIKNNLSLFKSKITFITSSIAVHNLISKKLRIKSFLLGNQKNFDKNFDLLKKEFLNFHKILNILDKDKNINKLKINKDLKIFFNSHRYYTSLEYASIKNIIYNLDILCKKIKIKKIYLIGNLRFRFFSSKVFQEELKLNNINLEICEKTITSNNVYLKFLNFLNKFNSLTVSQIILYFKKNLSKALIFSPKKNLIFEPLWDFFYYPYKLSQNYFINLNKINFETTNKTYVNLDYQKIIKKNKFKFSSFFLKFLINQTFIIDKKVFKSLFFLNKLRRKYRIKNICWCCDPDAILANIVEYFRKENIRVYGIQHGGSYNLQNYNFLHKFSDFSFCDKYLSYGISNKTKNSKIIDSGSFKSEYYKNEIKKIHITELKRNVVLFIVGGVNEIYPNKNNPYIQFNFQKNAYNYLKSNKVKTIIKIPQVIEQTKYPILDYIDQNHKKTLISKIKTYKAINLYKPKLIILDRLSTTLYECLFYEIEIILFLDKKELPYSDILKILKKRVHFVYNIHQFKNVYKMILEKKVSKLNDDFLKKFYIRKKNKKIKNFIDTF